jgi:transposase
VDETGSNVAMTPLYARALIGTRAVGKVPKNHGVNLTIVGAIALDGVRALMAYEGGTTKEAFMRFVREVLIPSLNPGDVVVMDNLRVHHSGCVAEAIRAVGADVMYLPSYSPELNPIERTWSKLKGLLRRAEARTLRALAAALSICSREISLRDINGWYRHSGYVAQCA